MPPLLRYGLVALGVAVSPLLTRASADAAGLKIFMSADRATGTGTDKYQYSFSSLVDPGAACTLSRATLTVHSDMSATWVARPFAAPSAGATSYMVWTISLLPVVDGGQAVIDSLSATFQSQTFNSTVPLTATDTNWTTVFPAPLAGVAWPMKIYAYGECNAAPPVAQPMSRSVKGH